MIIIDINEYLKLINICNPKVVFKGYKERGMGYPYNEYFLFFDNNGIGYKINGNGYKNLYDIYDGCPKGFPDGKTYYKAMAGEFVDYNEYKKITEMGYYSKNDYLEAIELGFKWSFEKIKKYLCYEDYGIFSSSPRKYYIHDDDRETYIKSDRDVYYYAKKKGFKDFKEFEDAISKGFLNAEEYRDAMKKGFSDKETYGDAKEMGFDNPKEYEEAMKFGLRSKDEYDEFKRRLGKILDIKKEYELDTIEEAILFKILLNFEHGKKLSAEKIWNMWKDELEKYRNYIKNGIKFNNKDDFIKAVKLGIETLVVEANNKIKKAKNELYKINLLLLKQQRDYSKLFNISFVASLSNQQSSHKIVQYALPPLNVILLVFPKSNSPSIA